MIFDKTRSDPKYLLDSLFYLAGSQAPYIHVILSDIVSITWYINQPLVRLLLHITNLQLVWYHLHRFLLCNDLIQLLVRIHLTLFHFNILKQWKEGQGVFGRVKIAIKHIVGHFQKNRYWGGCCVGLWKGGWNLHVFVVQITLLSPHVLGNPP